MKTSGVLAVFAFFLGSGAGHLYLRKEAEALRGGRTREAVQLVRALEVGATLGRTDLRVVQVPERFWDPRSLSLEAVLKNVGKRTTRGMLAGAFLLQGDEALGDGQPKLTELLEPGFRAYLLRPEQILSFDEGRHGDRVDLVLVPRERSAPEVLLENVEVLGGREPGAKLNSGAALSLALAVRPEDALRLAGAEMRGKFRVLLRNRGDQLISETEPTGQKMRVYEAGTR